MRTISGLLFLLIALTTSSADALNRQSLRETELARIDVRLRDKGRDLRSAHALSLPDYRISQAGAPARFSQSEPSVVFGKDSNPIVAWSDEREGAQKVFAQRYGPSGTPVGTNLVLAGGNGSEEYFDPELAVDTTGRVHLFYRSSWGILYYRRLTSSLAPEGAPVVVNDTASLSIAGLYDVALYPDGRLAIVWLNFTLNDNTIQVRIYDPTGNSVLGPDRVDTDGTFAAKWAPCVAVDPSSGFLVGWEDLRSGNGDIYVRLYNGAGTPLGAEFNVIPPLVAAQVQATPEIVFSTRDKYLITWIDDGSGVEVYAQKYNATTGLDGTSFVVSEDDPLIECSEQRLSVDADGDARIGWRATGAVDNILIRNFSAGFALSGAARVVNASSIGARSEPSIAHSGTNEYGVARVEVGQDEADIRLRLFSAADAPLGSEIQTNDDARGAPVRMPAVKHTTGWTNLTVFESARYDAGDIMLGAINNSGVIEQSNTKVNQGLTGTYQSSPRIDASSTKALTVWSDARDIAGIPGLRIFGRFSNLFGVFSENEFVISDSTVSSTCVSPHLAMTPSGQALVIWFQVGGANGVLGRWLANDGTPDGTQFLIEDVSAGVFSERFAIGIDNASNFYVISSLDSGGTQSFRVRKFNSAKTLVGTYTWALPAQYDVTSFDADVTASGSSVMLWTDFSTGSVFVNSLSTTGAQLLPPIEVTDDPAPGADRVAVAVAKESEHISCTWVDTRNGIEQVFYQVLDDFGFPLGINEPVSSVSTNYMLMPATHAYGGRAIYVWVDPREQGDNVWGANTVFLPTDIDDPENPALPRSFTLGANFPNPFNPSTEIPFSLARRTHVRLTIHNLLGQTVRTLIDDTRPAGTFRQKWDGSDDRGVRVSSGVYFYRLVTDEGEVSRRMALIK